MGPAWLTCEAKQLSLLHLLDSILSELLAQCLCPFPYVRAPSLGSIQFIAIGIEVCRPFSVGLEGL
jgi:hypothetical protein